MISITQTSLIFLGSGILLGGSIAYLSQGESDSPKEKVANSSVSFSPSNKTLTVDKNATVNPSLQLSDVIAASKNFTYSTDFEKILIPYVYSIPPEKIENELTHIWEQISKSQGEWNSEAETLFMTMSLLMERFGTLSPQQAFEYSQKVDQIKFLFNYHIYQAWSIKDPENAIRHFNEQNFSSINQENIYYSQILAKNLGYYNPDEALKWGEELSRKMEGTSCLPIYTSLFQSIAAKDIKLALDKLNKLPDQKDIKETAVASIVSEWMRKDPGSVKDWINTLPEGQKKAAQQCMIKSLSMQDPTLANTELKSSQLNAEERDRLMPLIAQGMAKDSPEQALNWLQSNASQPNTFKDNLYGILDSWIRQDQVAAKNWAMSLTDNMNKIDAVMSFANMNPNPDQSENIEMIMSLKGTTENEKTTISLEISERFQSWYYNNKEEASRWIESSSMDQDMKNSLLNPVKKIKVP